MTDADLKAANDAVVAAQATAKLKQSAADAASAALAAAISAIEADLTAVTDS